MKTISIALLAALSLAAFAIPAEAHRGGPGFFGGPGGGFPGPGLMIEHMADHLDLDDAQRAQVENILKAARPEIQAIREQARANHAALESLDATDPATSAQLNNIAISNGQLATEGTLLAVRVRSEIHAVLTDEQLEKLERGKERMRAAFEQRKNNRER